MDNKQPLISVIIPVYNTEKYLESCLESIINNTYRNLEIICINDGSTDNSLSILSKYKENDPRIVLINQKNRGVSATRNKGLEVANGDYLSFVDSDDYIHRYYFQILLHCMLKKKADIVCCNAIKVRVEETVEKDGYKNVCFKRINSKQAFGSYYTRHNVWAKLYKQEVLKGHTFDPSILISEDTVFNLEVMGALNNPIVYETDTPLYFYVQHEDSSIHSADYAGLKHLSDYYKKYNNEVKSLGGWGWMLPMHVLKFTLSYRFFVRFRPDAKELNKEANIAIKMCLKDLKGYTIIPKKEIIKHWIMYLYPGIYTIFRLVNDPTMLSWEINENRIFKLFRKKCI